MKHRLSFLDSVSSASSWQRNLISTANCFLTGASPRGGRATQLLPEVVPEIEANLASFYREEGG